MLYTILYSLVVGGLVFYLLAMLTAVFAVIAVTISANVWEVDPRDPLAKGGRGVIRQFEVFEFVVVGKAGSPTFPVMRQTGKRLSVKGLQSGHYMDKNINTEWEAIVVDDNAEYKPHVQSRLGFFSPVFVFRWAIHKFTGRHVVRVWLPFFVFGFYELYAPITMKFVRARQENSPKTSSMTIVDPVSGSEMVIIEDITDHVLWEFPLRIITDTLPTRDGYSVRADVTIVFKLVNVLNLVSWQDWSSQIRSVVGDTASSYFRSGTLDQVYATTEKDGRKLQDAIMKNLKNGDEYPFRTEDKNGNKVNMSIMEVMGLECQNVTLNDLIPADNDSKKQIERIMAILAEGRSNAKTAGLFLKEQTKVLSKVDPKVRENIAALTAAQKSEGKIDWIIGSGGMEDTTLAVQNRTAKNTAKTSSKGGKK